MTLKHLGGMMLLAASMPLLGHAESAPATNETESQLFRLDVTARIDWQLTRFHDMTEDSETGFKGKYLMWRMDGQIVKGLTYSWRQRFNKGVTNNSFFENTDWLYVNYANKGWNFAAGKQVVAIGGWEYDRAPYDLYGCSVFWNNVPCFQFGASAGYDVTANDRLTFQVSQSPFHSAGNNNMYAYNLMWNGHHGCFDAIYSANLVEYAKDKYISYIALGSKFTFGKCYVELDLMNRAASHQTYFGKDYSIIGEFAYNPTSRFKLHVKGTYDTNKTETTADALVSRGTDLKMIGGGVEYYPLLKDRTALRLHANVYYSWGDNNNTYDLMQNKTTFASVGVTWNMNLLNIKKKH